MTEYEPREPYPRPPITEALFQVTFAEPLEWNVTTPGRLFERIRENYPGEPEMQDQFSANFETQEGSGEGPNFAVSRQGTRIIYRSAGRDKFVIGHPGYLTVGSNPPYDGWPNLRSRMRWLLDAVADMWTLPVISGVSIRYLNQIVLPSARIDTDDFFTIPIRTARQGAAALGSFVYRVESVIPGGDIARSTFASMARDDGANAFLLDLEFLRQEHFASFEEAQRVADRLKNLENEEFESCITDATRELFH